jgi:CelD/BcsL family acetyltransferase involved in cellulose biosynthesis
MVLRRLVGLGTPLWDDYLAPILGADSSGSDWVQPMYTEVVKECCRRGIDFIQLQNLPELIEHQRNPLLELQANKTKHQVRDVNSYAARLNGTWESYYSLRRDARARRDSRRQRNRLSKLGRLRFVVAQEQGDVLRFVEKMMEQKSRRYCETGVPDLFADPVNSDFCRAFALDLVPKGVVHISALMLDDRILATHWGRFMGSDSTTSSRVMNVSGEDTHQGVCY